MGAQVCAVEGRPHGRVGVVAERVHVEPHVPREEHLAQKDTRSENDGLEKRKKKEAHVLVFNSYANFKVERANK